MATHDHKTPSLTPTDLTLDPLNANRGTPRGRRALRESLRDLGAGRPILIDRNGVAMGGNKTLHEARELGVPIEIIPSDGSRLFALQRTDLDLATDPRARRLAVADNRIAELDLDWDPEVLALLQATGVSLEGLFSNDEVERLLGHGLTMGLTEENAVVAPPATTAIMLGDLFELGPHRVLCGDATDPAHVARVLDGDAPLLMTTDPPYGIGYSPEWRHDYDPQARTAVGRVANDDRVDWSAAWRHFPGPVAYVWHAGLHAGTVAASLQLLGFELRAQIIWVKQTPVLSRGAFHWKHEPCWYAVRAGHSAGWTGDRSQTTVWEVANFNPFGGSRTIDDAATGHGTQKPVALFERPILNHTHQGDLVFDPFLGSGTALIAAEKTNRRCRAVEIDPCYVQAAIDRWERFTGAHAVKR